MTHPNARRTAGSMTLAMSAHRTHDLARVLRVGVIQDNAILEERILRERANVSIGTTERATIPVQAPNFPAHRELFIVRGGQWALCVTPGTEGRIALDQSVRTIDDCMREGSAVREGDGWVIALTETSRGKVTLAGVTVLFQFVQAPPEAPRPQLPSGLKRSLATEVDWRYNASLSCFLALAVSALGWVEYGYDPVVDDLNDTAALVARAVRMDSTFNEAPPEPAPTEAAAAPDTATQPNSTPSNTRPSHTHASHEPPRGPSPDAMRRAEASANAAIAAATRSLDASFAPITALAHGPNSAVDQLAQNALLDGSVEDLRNVNSISSRPASALSRPSLVASNVPHANTLGRPTLTQTGPGPDTGTLRDPVGPRTQLVTRPEEPETDTCDGDAGAVARSLRNNLGGLRSCYERASRMNPALEGRVTLRFTVGTNGRAISSTASGMDEINECLATSVRRIVFPVPACGVAEYSFPITFSHGSH